MKGIEPSYSAWKAAALPLSYTRARPINYHGRQAASTTMSGFGPLGRPCKRPLFPRRPSRPAGPLTRADSVPILRFPSTTKGGDPVSYTKRCHLAGIVLHQALSPRWDRPLGLFKPGTGALSAPGPASYKSWGATGAIPSRFFFDLEEFFMARLPQRLGASRRPMAGSGLNPESGNQHPEISALMRMRDCRDRLRQNVLPANAIVRSLRACPATRKRYRCFTPCWPITSKRMLRPGHRKRIEPVPEICTGR